MAGVPSCLVRDMPSGCACVPAAGAHRTSDRLFWLSPPFILIQACFAVQQWPGLRSLLLFANVNQYGSMRSERSLTKGGIWPGTAQYTNYCQPDEVPFHQYFTCRKEECISLKKKKKSLRSCHMRLGLFGEAPRRCSFFSPLQISNRAWWKNPPHKFNPCTLTIYFNDKEAHDRLIKEGPGNVTQEDV